MIYSFALVSGVWQTDAFVCKHMHIYIYIYTHTHIYIFSRFFYLIDYYKIMSFIPSPTDPAVKGSRMTDSKICHCGLWVISSWQHSRLCWLRKIFYLSINYLKDSDQGAGSERAIPRDNFYLEWPTLLHGRQTSDYQISALIILWIYPPPLEVTGPFPIP